MESQTAYQNVIELDTEKQVKTIILSIGKDSSNRELLRKHVIDMGHDMYDTDDEDKALAMLKSSRGTIGAVIINLPHDDMIHTARLIKGIPQTSDIPVISITETRNIEDVMARMSAEIFDYLVMPVKKAELREVLLSALRSAEKKKKQKEEQHRQSIVCSLIDSCKFKVSTMQEAENLSLFVANLYPSPDRALPGITELLVNAIEHGTLGIGYHTKTELINNDTWRKEIGIRESLPENDEKIVEVTVASKSEGIYLIIEDQGDGFEWKKFINIDPARAADGHGRGIAKAKAMSFDKLSYNEKGNKAVAFAGYRKEIEW